MTTFQLSIIFFLVGGVEWYLDTWEKLVSVRLKLWSTILYSTLNQTIDFFMYVFLFSVLIQFWETWHNGVHDYYKLIPYVLYTLGKVVGTGFATWLYAFNKKKRDKDRAVKHLEKTTTRGKRSKKKYDRAMKKAVSTMSDETLLDSVEVEDVKDAIKARVIESASQKIADKIDSALEDK